MLTPDLIAWQRTHYDEAHQSRRNLLLHAVSAPLAWVALALVVALRSWGALLPALAGLLLVAALQGAGHRLEKNPPRPFRSPLDVLARLLIEQFVTFPRFIASGDFARAWRAAGEQGQGGAR